MARILVVDDDPSIRFLLEQLLTAAGHEVVTIDDGCWISRALKTGPFQLVFTDIVMKYQGGLENVTLLHHSQPGIGIVAMSGDPHLAKRYLDTATRLGAKRTLIKPFSKQQLEEALAATLPVGSVPEESAPRATA